MLQSFRDFPRIVTLHAGTALHHANSLSVSQKLYTVTFFLIIIAFTTIFITYHTAIFNLIEAWKSDLVESRWKWLILVGITAATSFPPLIGYSTSVTLAGYVFGFLYGWLIAVLGSLVGAATTFFIYRHFLSGYAKRMSAQNQTFMALTKALEGAEGLTLLTMMRFCPFPFSLSNAALSTIPSVTFPRFTFATAIGTLRLTVHAFVGSRLAHLAQDGDTKSLIVNWIGIIVGLTFGISTGYIVYKRTRLIANTLNQEHEQENGRHGSRHGDEEDASWSDDANDEANALLR